MEFNLWELAKRYKEEFIPDTDVSYEDIINDPVAQAKAAATMLRGKHWRV